VALRLGVGEGDHELDAERGGDALEGVKAWGHTAGFQAGDGRLVVEVDDQRLLERGSLVYQRAVCLVPAPPHLIQTIHRLSTRSATACSASGRLCCPPYSSVPPQPPSATNPLWEEEKVRKLVESDQQGPN